MALIYIDRFHPMLRQQRQAAIDAGRLQLTEEVDLLDNKTLRSLALLSILLLLIGSVFFIGLNLFAYSWRTGSASVSFDSGTILLWCLISLLIAVCILPLHEAIHALFFLLWGGMPHFGAKLPIALYCGARNQVFRRNHYLAVGLAPLIVLTFAAIVLTLIAPVLASYTLFASLSNFSGAAGDVWVAWRLLKQRSDVLVEDTDSGYRIYTLS